MKLFGMKVTAMGCAKCLLVFFLLSLMFNLAVGACSAFRQEGFTNNGADIRYRMGEGVVLGGGGKAWDMRNFKVPQQAGQTEGAYKIPPENMNVFEGVRFAPECCPSTYSSSVGCSCHPANLEAYVAQQRGGNNTKQCGSY